MFFRHETHAQGTYLRSSGKSFCVSIFETCFDITNGTFQKMGSHAPMFTKAGLFIERFVN
jgi:hypothetical protein